MIEDLVDVLDRSWAGLESGPVSILLCRAFLSSNISSEMLVLHKCSMIFVAVGMQGSNNSLNANAAAEHALAIYEQLKAKHPDVMLSSPLEKTKTSRRRSSVQTTT